MDREKKIKYFVFGMPYFFFNYDLSKCPEVAKIRLNYMDIFDNFHHYGSDNSQIHKIKQYKI